MSKIKASKNSRVITEWNKDCYNNKLYSLEQLEAIQLNEDATKFEKLGKLSPLWTSLELFGKDHKIEPRNCTKLVYMFVNLDYEVTPYKIAGIEFRHPVFYIGEGTLERCISHTIVTKKDLTQSATLLKQIMLDFKLMGKPIGIVFAAVGTNVDGAKEVEADLIQTFLDLQHYTKGIESLRYCQGILNQRRETACAGNIFEKGELKNK